MSRRTVSSAPVTTMVKAKEKNIYCGSCESELEHDHPGIQCVQGHHFCTECSANIVRIVFSEPENYIPVHCLQCHVELIPNVFERQLTPAQQEIYQHHMVVFTYSKDFLKEDERLDHCPFCVNAVIRNKNASHLFYCDHPNCGKVSCLVCRKACPKIINDYEVTDEELEEMEKHFICAELADHKVILDQYIELGQKVPCPKCGLAGMKDEACTHMTCPRCSQIWCYFCGKKYEDLDRAKDSDNGIFDHNHNWEHTSRRCPMYLTQIQDVDNRWTDNEFGCLAMFHRIRSLRLLREAYEKLGRELIQRLDRHFNSITTCGFTFEEIQNEDLTLIRYQNNNNNNTRL